MIKKRIIASLLLKNDLVVQSIGFNQYLPIGRLNIALSFLENWDVDEVIILDIDASLENRTINFDLIKESSKNIFVPITVGGGITSISDIEKSISNGADKVSLNSVFFKNKNLIKEAAKIFGSQCLVLCADVKRNTNEYFVYSDGVNKNIKLKDWTKEVQILGAGEMLINSINNDGSKMGFEIDIYKEIANNVEIPLIAMGGAGNPKHILDLFKKTSVDAAAIGNILHHKEHSTSKIKSFMIKNNQSVRPSCFIDYEKHKFDRNGDLYPTNHKSLFIK